MGQRLGWPKARMAKGPKARMAKGSMGQRAGAKGPEGNSPSAARRLEAKIVHTFDAHTQLGPPSPRGAPVCVLFPFSYRSQM